MAEAHKDPQEYTLRIRRYDPESGEAAYWDEHTIELEPHRSVLEGILQARARFDGSIGIRCSCRAAICGSCGVRINGKPTLACHTHLDKAAAASSRCMWQASPGRPLMRTPHEPQMAARQEQRIPIEPSSRSFAWRMPSSTLL